jgi:Lactonase, 7-bladed beta-propeller
MKESGAANPKKYSTARDAAAQALDSKDNEAVNLQGYAVSGLPVTRKELIAASTGRFPYGEISVLIGGKRRLWIRCVDRKGRYLGGFYVRIYSFRSSSCQNEVLILTSQFCAMTITSKCDRHLGLCECWIGTFFCFCSPNHLLQVLETFVEFKGCDLQTVKKEKFRMARLRESWPRQALCWAVVLVTNGLAAGRAQYAPVRAPYAPVQAPYAPVLVQYAPAQAQYVVTNDDPGVSFYTVAPNGVLTLKQQILTGLSSAGGYFGANRIQALDSGNQQCIYASTAASGEIVGIPISTLTVVGSASGSPTDNGASNGIGMAINSQYLYASFTGSNTIGTFALEEGCGLAFVNDVSVGGLAGGMIDGMAIHGNMMIATFTDGSIESFDISSGTPMPNGDEKYSTAALTSQDATYPNSIDITSDGRFAIFGDTSSSMVVEVSDISSGKLSPTRVYTSTASISSSNVILSPDESVLYVVNTQGASVSAFLFDKKTGRLTWGCTSGPIRGQSSNWSYLGGAGLIRKTGNGGGVYVAEFGDSAGIAMVTLESSSFGRCSLRENVQSPFADGLSHGLISIGTFPPRDF